MLITNSTPETHCPSWDCTRDSSQGELKKDLLWRSFLNWDCSFHLIINMKNIQKFLDHMKLHLRWTLMISSPATTTSHTEALGTMGRTQSGPTFFSRWASTPIRKRPVEFRRR
jgi:hypothetical protein